MNVLDKWDWEYPLPIVKIGLKIIRENPNKNFVELMRVFGIEYPYLKGNSQMMYNFLKEVDKVNNNFISKKENLLHLWLDSLQSKGYTFDLIIKNSIRNGYYGERECRLWINDEDNCPFVSMYLHPEILDDVIAWFNSLDEGCV